MNILLIFLFYLFNLICIITQISPDNYSNSSSSLLVDIIRFSLLRIIVSLTVLKCKKIN